MNKIILNENQLKRLFEYHAQQRLPFDDDFYGKKNQAEQYLDWLEEFGKYGKIGNSSLNFQECVEQGIKDAVEHKRLNEYYDGIDDILLEKFKHIHYDERGNIYVERAVNISDNVESVANDLFATLSDKYHNNVGGCWAFKPGEGYAYCTKEKGALVLLKGYIRLEDIDWLKTCDLNFHQDEYEIRVKPNAKVELFEVLVNGKYKLPLQDTLIVTSTYFGNRSSYDGEFATVDDGMGGRRLINRQGEYVETDQKIKHFLGNNCCAVEVDDYDIFGMNKIGIYNLKTKSLITDKLFSYVGESFNEGYLKVREYIDDDFVWNFIDQHGEYLSDDYFNNCFNFKNGKAIVQLMDGTHNIINLNGEYLFKNNVRHVDYLFNDVILFKTENGCNLYDCNEGEFIFDELLKDFIPCHMDYSGFIIFKNGSCNVFNFKEKIFLLEENSEWCSKNTYLINGYTWKMFKINGQFGYVNEYGNLMCYGLFDKCYEFKQEKGRYSYLPSLVMKDGKYNYLKGSGDGFLLRKWVNYATEFDPETKVATIQHETLKAIVKKDGSMEPVA